MAETKPSVDLYKQYADSQVDEQAILDKYNAATIAQYNTQREQNRQAENNFYNQMYNTQKTAMDTIRNTNAAAVSTGASRGVQAAQELSAILGLQEDSVAQATELAQANRQTAQEETAAVLENVLAAYQQAQQDRNQLIQQGIESASVDATKLQAEATMEQANAANKQADAALKQADTTNRELSIKEKEAQTDVARLLTEAAENGTATYLTALQQAGKDYSDGVVTPESSTSLDIALNNIGRTADGKILTFVADDWAGVEGSGANKAATIITNINSILDAYGLDKAQYVDELNALKKQASNSDVSWINGKQKYANKVNRTYQNIITDIKEDYANGINRKSKN